jgi:hypothetical protein
MASMWSTFYGGTLLKLNEHTPNLIFPVAPEFLLIPLPEALNRIIQSIIDDVEPKLPNRQMRGFFAWPSPLSFGSGSFVSTSPMCPWPETYRRHRV